MVGGDVFRRPNCTEPSDGSAAKHSDDKQPGSTQQQQPLPPTPPLCSGNRRAAAVVRASSVALDAGRRSTASPPAADDDDSDSELESLFGGDEWWASEQAWRWQCGGSPANLASADDAVARRTCRITSAAEPRTAADELPTADLQLYRNDTI